MMHLLLLLSVALVVAGPAVVLVGEDINVAVGVDAAPVIFVLLAVVLPAVLGVSESRRRRR